jgi:geranylgeranyl diphosphate synthase type II
MRPMTTLKTKQAFPRRPAKMANQRPGFGDSPAQQDRGLTLLGAEDFAFVLEGYGSLLDLPETTQPALKGVLTDLLRHPGSLARAQLAFAILTTLDEERQQARRLAVALEYFHTASLVFDDLPNMDDASERRGATCPHLVHGEAAATLAALALITRAYHLLWQVLDGLPSERRRRASDLVSSCLGVAGILDGQAKDLHFDAKKADESSVEAVAAGKTVTLVRLSLVLPALVGGASERELQHLEELSHGWGFAYQILDDLKDVLLGREDTGKSTAQDLALGRPNMAGVLGCDGALARLSDHLHDSRRQIDALQNSHCAGSRLGKLQAFLEVERERMRLRLGARCA